MKQNGNFFTKFISCEKMNLFLNFVETFTDGGIIIFEFLNDTDLFSKIPRLNHKFHHLFRQNLSYATLYGERVTKKCKNVSVKLKRETREHKQTWEWLHETRWRLREHYACEIRSENRMRDMMKIGKDAESQIGYELFLETTHLSVCEFLLEELQLKENLNDLDWEDWMESLDRYNLDDLDVKRMELLDIDIDDYLTDDENESNSNENSDN